MEHLPGGPGGAIALGINDVASRNDFDPSGAVTDWLDACRAGETNALLDLDDDRAILECDCEGVSPQGANRSRLTENRNSIAS